MLLVCEFSGAPSAAMPPDSSASSPSEGMVSAGVSNAAWARSSGPGASPPCCTIFSKRKEYASEPRSWMPKAWAGGGSENAARGRSRRAPVAPARVSGPRGRPHRHYRPQQRRMRPPGRHASPAPARELPLLRGRLLQREHPVVLSELPGEHCGTRAVMASGGAGFDASDENAIGLRLGGACQPVARAQHRRRGTDAARTPPAPACAPQSSRIAPTFRMPSSSIILSAPR